MWFCRLPPSEPFRSKLDAKTPTSWIHRLYCSSPAVQFIEMWFAVVSLSIAAAFDTAVPFAFSHTTSYNRWFVVCRLKQPAVVSRRMLNLLVAVRRLIFFVRNIFRFCVHMWLQSSSAEYRCNVGVSFARLAPVTDPKILKGGGRRAEDKLSAPSSFIANAHDEILTFYTEKKRLFDVAFK